MGYFTPVVHVARGTGRVQLVTGYRRFFISDVNNLSVINCRTSSTCRPATPRRAVPVAVTWCNAANRTRSLLLIFLPSPFKS